MAVGASPSRPASISSSQGGGDDLDGVADRCFSSKEMVTQVLRNSSGNHAGHIHPFVLLVVVDVSGGRLNEILQEAASLARIKHQVPCRVACITDLKTSSEDLRRLKEVASCDMDLRKPIHGSRLRKLLPVMRELQASPFPQQHSHQVGITINELPAADQATAASSEITSAAAVPQEPPRLGDDKPLEVTATSSQTTSAAAVPQEPPKLEDDKPLEGKRVLLVEDTRVLQFIQKKLLSTLGTTVVVAADGSEAIAMFINALEIASGGAASEERVALPYDTIFMDCQMQVMDGYEATKRIREEESRYGIHTPIIALTAHSEEEDLQKTIKAGMDLHLTKPIQKEKVVEAVHQGMPAAEGAVAAAAVADQMYGPKEDRKLVIVLVGLPARGKTFTAAKLTRYLRWLGHETKHFNVGKYRRLKHGTNQTADFFRGDNKEGVEARNEVAALAMEDMLSWMEEGGQVGICDATNSTRNRRNMLMKMAEGKCKIIFVETICNDQDVLERNIRLKVQQSPDYAEQTDFEAGVRDFKERLAYYEKVYEPVEEGSYIKMIDMVSGNGGQLQVNCHLTPRPILLTRHGESLDNVEGRIGGDSSLSEAGQIYSRKLASFVEKRLKSERTASIWTSTLQRTILTAHPIIGFPKIQWRALDEINAGVCDGMTYEEVKKNKPEDYESRRKDKLRYRHPRGESYLNVIQRLEPVIIELERQRSPVVVIAHQESVSQVMEIIETSKWRAKTMVDFTIQVGGHS
ncbi:hypothetical protein ACQ4PT_000348 [Festuca glaucescens]